MVQQKSIEENIWIVDTGALAHMTNDMKGMYNVKTESTRTVTMGDRQSNKVEKIRK